MYLPDDHLFFTAGQDVQALIAPLKKYHINYFTYNKNYHDGRHIRLTTHPNHLKAFLANGYHKTGNIDAHPKLYTDQVQLFSSLKNQTLVQWLRNDFKVDNGIYIIRTGKDYTEFFSFATPIYHHEALHFYLNNIDFLENFCSYFKRQGEPLIIQAEKNALVHEFHQKPGVIDTIKVKLPPLFRMDNIKLTRREYEVSRHLLAGARTKAIAIAMNINQRTVEDYILRLRRKFKARSITDLAIRLVKANIV